MADIKGLLGQRPNPEKLSSFVTPPYDVIKPGSPLEAHFEENPDSLFHITLGSDPVSTFEQFIANKILLPDTEPCFYVYEQSWSGNTRTGVLAAINVDDYAEHNIIRHEKTFDKKVQGRIALAQATGYSFEPIFFLTQSDIHPVLESVLQNYTPLYAFNPDFNGFSDLHQVATKIYRVPEASVEGQALKDETSKNPLYIADGHHRYHAALRNNQKQTLGYIVQNAQIQAYNRVVNGKVNFADIKDRLDLKPCAEFQTPPKHSFCIYSSEGPFLLDAKSIPEDVLGKLDCSILEKELYPHLGVTHDMIMDENCFDYYPEFEIPEMKKLVDEAKFDIALALHPVSVQELIDVADAGLKNPEIVMPEKSTFFSPKILSGLILFNHSA
ncbi:MAG: DUF1015 domain-containing protein [Fibrobacteria bacterium]|nr:DUF1015 domain-containing protein [Fibrobacteria bacterium]